MDLRAARQLTRVQWELTAFKDFEKPNLNPHRIDISAIRPLANLIRTVAIAAHLRGDDAAFLEYLHDLQWIVEITYREAGFASRFVAGSIDSMAASMVGKVAGELRLDTPALRDETRARMAAWMALDRLSNRWISTARDGRFFLRVGDTCQPVLGDNVLRLANERPGRPWEGMDSRAAHGQSLDVPGALTSDICTDVVDQGTTTFICFE